MPTDSNNNRYPVPVPFKGGPYDDDVNRNFDSLAVDVPDSGPIADRPDASNEFAPQRYYADNDGIEHFNTGSSWRAMGADPIPFQMARDGAIVPIAPGVGYLNAIDPETANSPVQDAINAVEAVGVSADGRYGAGTVLLPPGVTETPGNLHTLAGKRIIGWGREASILRVIDSSANGFAIGGNGGNVTKAYLDGFTIDGGDRAARSSGSAINAAYEPPDGNDANMIRVGFNIGQLQFQNWGGPDPVINNLGSFSATWNYLRATDYDGKFIYTTTGFHNNIGMISVNHGDVATEVIHFDGNAGVCFINSINIGGSVGKALVHDGGYARYGGLHIGHINMEPDADGGSTLSDPAPIKLLGPVPVSIKSMSQDDSLDSQFTVELGNHSFGGSNEGPGNNSIGPSIYRPSTAGVVTVTAPHVDPSWYYGSAASGIAYNGNSTRSCIPMYDLDFTV